jgi:CheY-like chemotaxis protein
MLDKLIAAMQHPDICILDIRMQEMDGYDLIAEISRRCPLRQCQYIPGAVDHWEIANWLGATPNCFLKAKEKCDRFSKPTS